MNFTKVIKSWTVKKLDSIFRLFITQDSVVEECQFGKECPARTEYSYDEFINTEDSIRGKFMQHDLGDAYREAVTFVKGATNATQKV